MKRFRIKGMSCAACQARVEKAVSGVPGVTSCAVSLITDSMNVEGSASDSDIIKAVKRAGYSAETSDGESRDSRAAENPRDALRELKIRLAVSAGLLVILMYITMGHGMMGLPLPAFFSDNHVALGLVQMLLALAVMAVNRRFFTHGFGSLMRGGPNMDTLVALGSSVSFAWSLFLLFKMTGLAAAGDSSAISEIYHGGLYFETAAMIPALITVGKLLESIAKGKTRGALEGLIRLTPKKARKLSDGVETEVEAASLAVGDLFALRPGDSVPVDGVVAEGESAIDESALTGESVPADKKPGDTVSAATVNKSGYLVCRATRVGEDTSLSRIIRLVSDASATKAPIARIADRVSAVFVPAVIGIALLTVAGWLIAGAGAGAALERGIAVLVISCPCALGLATPVAIMVGNGIGAKNGILFKTGEALETVGKADVVMLDKTGTVTEGKPKVTDIITAPGFTEEELLTAAASLERKSEHPLAKAVVSEASERGLKLSESSGFRTVPGNGLEAVIEGVTVRGGKRDYVSGSIPDSLSAAGEALASEGKTPLYFSFDGSPAGIIAVSDVIKESSAEAAEGLKKLGTKVVMLTGDNEKTAFAVARRAGIESVRAGVLPEGKAAAVREGRREGVTVMVGDGINDAPALTVADVGIAIGAGTDVAIDSADVVLVNSDPRDVPAAIRLGRATLRNIRENLFWAFFYNLLCIPLAAGLFGIKMSPMIGAAAMSLSSVTVCLNALRLNLFDIRDGRHDRPRRRKKTAVEAAPVYPDSGEIIIGVEGMMCGHCEKRVKRALEKLDFVELAEPDHEKKRVKIILSGRFDPDAAAAAVGSEDYKYTGTVKF